MRSIHIMLSVYVLCTLAAESADEAETCYTYDCSDWHCEFPYSLNCSSAVSASGDLGNVPSGKYSKIELEATPVTKLHENSFRDARAIEYLVRRNVDLVDVEEGALGKDNLEIIQLLNFNGNNIAVFPFSSLSAFHSVIVLDLSHNSLSKVPDNVQWPKTLQELYLSWNSLSVFPFDSIKDLVSLKSLQLAANHLGQVSAVEWPQQLERLNLNINDINDFPYYSLKNHTALQILNLAENQLDSVPNDIQWPATLNNIYLMSNKISTITANTFATAIGLQHISVASNLLSHIANNILWPDALVELLLHVNYLTEFPFHTIEELPHLKMLALDHNQLEIIPSNVQWPSTLEELTLSGNRISYIASETFSAATGLRHLWLSHNKLAQLGKGAFYTSSPHRPELWLNYNQIVQVEENAFGEQSGGMQYGEIGLSHNQLSTFSERVFSKLLLNAISNREQLILYVSENPIRCDCKMMWLYSHGAFYGENFTSQVPDLVCNGGVAHEYLFWDLPPSYFEAC